MVQAARPFRVRSRIPPGALRHRDRRRRLIEAQVSDSRRRQAAAIHWRATTAGDARVTAVIAVARPLRSAFQQSSNREDESFATAGRAHSLGVNIARATAPRSAASSSTRGAAAVLKVKHCRSSE